MGLGLLNIVMCAAVVTGTGTGAAKCCHVRCCCHWDREWDQDWGCQMLSCALLLSLGLGLGLGLGLELGAQELELLCRRMCFVKADVATQKKGAA